MATYQLVGSQDPASRIDRVLVESPSEEYPDGKFLELDGEPRELSENQYTKLSRFVRLEHVKADEGAVVAFVDQPGVQEQSLSTDTPPNPGTTPDIDSLTRDQLVDELARVRADDPAALPKLSSSSKKEELATGLKNYHGQGA